MTRAVEGDKFAAGLKEIFTDIQNTSNVVTEKAVRKGIVTGKKAVVSNAAGVIQSHTGKYLKSWHYAVKGSEGKPEGHIYSDTPGLPHLLEKGHATMGGGFVAAREHIAPAADEAFDVTEETAKRLLEEEGLV